MTEEVLKTVEGQIIAIDHAAHKITVKTRDGLAHEMIWTAAYNGKMEKQKQWWFIKISAEKSGEYWKVASMDFFKRPDDWPQSNSGSKGGWQGKPRNEKIIVLQSSLKVAADLFQSCTSPGTQDFDAACKLVVEKAIEMSNEIMKAGGA